MANKDYPLPPPKQAHVHINDKCAAELLEEMESVIKKHNDNFTAAELLAGVSVLLASHSYYIDRRTTLEKEMRSTLEANISSMKNYYDSLDINHPDQINIVVIDGTDVEEAGGVN